MKQHKQKFAGRWIALVMLSSGAALAMPPAGHADDAEAGLAVAEQWCNACHSIGTEEPRQEDAGPIWTEIAHANDAELLAALDAPHDFMPEFPSLTAEDKANLVAYIKSLE